VMKRTTKRWVLAGGETGVDGMAKKVRKKDKKVQWVRKESKKHAKEVLTKSHHGGGGKKGKSFA